MGFRVGYSESPYGMPGGLRYSAFLNYRLLTQEDGVPFGDISGELEAGLVKGGGTATVNNLATILIPSLGAQKTWLDTVEIQPTVQYHLNLASAGEPALAQLKPYVLAGPGIWISMLSTPVVNGAKGPGRGSVLPTPTLRRAAFSGSEPSIASPVCRCLQSSAFSTGFRLVPNTVSTCSPTDGGSTSTRAPSSSGSSQGVTAMDRGRGEINDHITAQGEAGTSPCRSGKHEYAKNLSREFVFDRTHAAGQAEPRYRRGQGHSVGEDRGA